MPDHTSIYNHDADKYHTLISKQPHLDELIEQIRNFSGLDIVDVGAGTGRLTAVLAPRAKSIVALDASDAMLQVTAKRLSQTGLTNWRTRAADNRNLPLAGSSADLIVAGWTICYLASSTNPDWSSNLHDVMTEFRRVLKPDGTIIIFETLGTGVEAPKPPEFLKDYYTALVQEYGFDHRWIRGDYEFDDISQAAELTAFFFGDKLAEQVRAQHSKRLPECMGIWWLHGHP